MHEIDDQALVQALAEVIKSTVSDDKEWLHLKISLSNKTTLAVLLAKNWDVLALQTKKLFPSFDLHRNDFFPLEKIIFDTIEKYRYVKKVDSRALLLNEDERFALRKSIVSLLPEAFACAELKEEWAEEKKAFEESQLSSRFKYALRFAREQADNLLKRIASISADIIRNKYKSAIQKFKSALQDIEKNAEKKVSLSLFDCIQENRDQLSLIESNFPSKKDLYLQLFDSGVGFLMALNTEVENALAVIEKLLAHNSLGLQANEKMLDQYFSLKEACATLKTVFSTVLENIPFKSLRLSHEALLEVVRPICDLQKSADLLLTDIQNAVKEAEVKGSVVQQGVFRKRFPEKVVPVLDETPRRGSSSM